MAETGLCLAVLGPTCSWKSETALALAEHYHAEIISCDSMQVYRGLDIGTAKPSLMEQRRTRHHLISCLDMHEPFDANRFVMMAKNCLREVWKRDRVAVLAGGSGLYARALIYGFEMLPSNPQVARQLQTELEKPNGRQKLLSFLEAEVGAENTVPEEIYKNPRRLLRACEVVRITGKAPWLLAKKLEQPKPPFRQFCLLPNFSLLKRRILHRTERMLDAGWLEEALQAAEAGLLRTPTARQALGYRDIIEFVAAGSPGGQGALLELLSNRTIQYARRQLTWFKRQHPGATQIIIEDEKLAREQILEQIIRSLPY
jgi:tRNA dimethylallyltransferase